MSKRPSALWVRFYHSPLRSAWQSWVKYRHCTEFLNPSIGVRTSFNSGHKMNQRAH